MSNEKTSNRIYCWQIMECGEEVCPVRVEKITRCWEFMRLHNGFQCKYGLCDDCIMYLCKNEQASFTRRDLEQIMLWRSTAKSESYPL